MKVRVHIKVFGLLLFLILFLFTGLFLLRHSEEDKINMLLEDEGEEQSVLLGNTIKQVGENLDSFTKDYSLWSEMVEFIRSPQISWAKSNIEPGLSTFNIQAICIFDRNLSVKYSRSFLKRELSDILPVNNIRFREFVSTNNLGHFYTKTSEGILEVRMASVHPSLDSTRKTVPAGYLFAGRLWSSKHLNKFSKLLSSRVNISDTVIETPEPFKKDGHFIIKQSKALSDWDGKFTAVLTAERYQSIYERLYDWANHQFLSIILFSIISLILITIFLIKEFNGQKKVLEEEIQKKELAEAELMKMKDGLEELVEKRTAELGEVNEILKQEIAERKRAETEVAKFHSKLTEAVFGNPDSVNFTRLSDNIVLDANDNFCILTGYDKDEIIGKTTLELNLWVRPSERKALVDRLLVNNSESNFEAEFLTKSGVKKTGSISATIIEYKGEKAIIFVIRDVSERKRIENELIEYKEQLEKVVALRTSKLNELNASLSMQIEKFEEADNKIHDQLLLFSALLDTIPIPILIQDKNKVYTECNRAAEEFFGVQKKELAGKHKEDSLLNKALKTVDDSSESLSFESRVMMGNGEIKDVVIYRSIFKRWNNLPGGIITVLFDISDRKRIENELAKTVKDEKELNELKSRFISSASHQFRTPLATIQSSIDLLNMYGRKWSEDKYNAQLSIIQNRIEQMIELLDDILIVSKNEIGKVGFNPSMFDLYEFCMTTFNDIKSRGREFHSFVFNYNIEERQLYLDKKLLIYIFSNLLDNALKYTVSAGEIKLEINKQEDSLVILIIDSGMGIPQDELGDIFTAFYRSKNVGNLPGTGLGLSIVKKAVELHGGELSCSSILNQGTTFTVTLPLTKASVEQG